MFRPLSIQRFSSPISEFLPGPAPFLEWIETSKLVVDATYQREIGRRGAVNVNQIAENFDWSKFAPVIVAPVEGGHFAIVDGPASNDRRDASWPREGALSDCTGG